MTNKVVKLSHPVWISLGLFLIGGYLGGIFAAGLGDRVPWEWRLVDNRKVASIRTVHSSVDPEETTYHYMYKAGRDSVPAIAYEKGNSVQFTPTDRKFAEVDIWKSYPVAIFEPFVFFDGPRGYIFHVLEKDMPKGIETT